INGPINLSLKGQLQRCLTRVDYGSRLDNDTSYPAVNLATFSTERVNRLWIIMAAALFASGLLLVGWTSRGEYMASPGAEEAASSPRDLRVRLELGLIICLMLLVEPLTSKIYFVALMWPIAALLQFACEITGSRALIIRRAVWTLAIINFALPLLPGRSI